MPDFPSCTSRTPPVLLRDAPSSQGSRYLFFFFFLATFISLTIFFPLQLGCLFGCARQWNTETRDKAYLQVGCPTLWRGVVGRTAFPPAWRSHFGQSCPFSKPVFVQKLPTCRRATEGQNAQNGSSKQVLKPYKNAMVKSLSKKWDISLATWVLWQEESWPENSGLGRIQQLPLL